MSQPGWSRSPAPDTHETQFGARLRTLRTSRGWSQAYLGRQVFVSGDLIGKIEKARRRPTCDLIDRLDAALDAGGELRRAREALLRSDT